jgi:hypothetical protein
VGGHLTLESFEFGDPPDVVEHRRGRTCRGCKKLGYDATPGYEKWTCRLGKMKAAKAVEVTEKCEKFALFK